jgi:dTDP-4-dehydrorhamnose reductase
MKDSEKMFMNEIVKKRFLVTGANGLLGQRTIHFFRQLDNLEILGTSVEDKPVFSGIDYRSCDLMIRDQIKKVVSDFCPDFIVNTAAFTNVDLSETEKETAWKINVKGVEYLAEAARAIDAHIIHISSDYIFDGANGPYSEIDKPNPIGYYGRTKFASENALKISGAMYTILRTNVLYGIADSRPDFVRWVVKSVRDGKQINIVIDQVNNPTYIDDLVQAISKVSEFNKQGIYNIGGREFLTRFEFCEIIADVFNLDKTLIKPIVTEQLNQKAKRPLKSGLLTLKSETELGYKPHTIREALILMKRELNL